MNKKNWLAHSISLLLVLALVLLAGCGSGSTGTKPAGEAGSTGEAAVKDTDAGSTAAEATTEAPDPKEKFAGSWKLAAAESEGVTMSGNFSEMLGMSDTGMLNIKEDGTGDINLGEDSNAALSWSLKSDDVISLKPEKTTEKIGDFVEVKWKDDALFMDMEQDEKKATAIFTRDGVYADARQIDMAEAEPITSEKELLGKWKMTGMKIMGITVYGDPEALSAMSGGEDSDTSVTFKEGGVAVAASGEGSWKVDKDGATYTSEGFSGPITCPVKKLGDDIVIDMSEAFGGNEFITVLSK